MKGYFKNSSCLAQLCLLVLICLCSMCLAMFAYQVYSAIFPYNLRAALLIQNSFPLLLTAVATQYLITDISLTEAFELKNPGRILPIIGIFTFIAANPLVDLLNSWNQQLLLPDCMRGLAEWMIKSEKQVAELTNQLLSNTTWSGFLLNIMQIAFLAGLCEELLFRGVIQRIMIRWTKNIHAGVWIAAIIFSAIHLQFFGFVPRMILGALLGYLFVWSGSLWVPIIAHMTNNALVIISAKDSLKGANQLVESINKTTVSIWIGIGSLLFVCLGLYFLRKVHLRKKPLR